MTLISFQHGHQLVLLLLLQEENSTAGRFEVIDTKLYVLVVTLSTLDDAKLLQQLKPGFKSTIN